jgi:hypothetical protein
MIGNRVKYGSYHSVITGGDWNRIEQSCASGIFAGPGNRIQVYGPNTNCRDAILGGH